MRETNSGFWCWSLGISPIQTQGLILMLLVLSSFQNITYTLVFGSTSDDKPKHSSSLPKRSESSTLLTTEILHLEQLLQITETESSYDESREKAREYIVNTLTTPSKGIDYTFSADQVLYHKFDWTDTIVDNSEDATFTSLWRGINILAWTNKTSLKPGEKFSVVAAKYDSTSWHHSSHGNTYSCTTTYTKDPEKACLRGNPSYDESLRTTTLRTITDLFGSCVLLQLAKSVMHYQTEIKQFVESKSPLELLYFWDKKDPNTIETGEFEEVPILFIFFDHESIGDLGSKVWSQYYNIEKYFFNGDIRELLFVDVSGWRPHEFSTREDAANVWQLISPTVDLHSRSLQRSLTPLSEMKMMEQISSWLHSSQRPSKAA